MATLEEDMADAYYASTKRRLNFELLIRYIEKFCHQPPNFDTTEERHVFLTNYVNSLTQFSERVPPICLEQPTGDFSLYRICNLADELAPRDKKGNRILTPEMSRALSSFSAKPQYLARDEAVSPLAKLHRLMTFVAAHSIDYGLFDEMDIKIPFAIPYSAKDSDPKFMHTWVIGDTGSGKTNLLRNLILEDLKRDDECLIIMDSKGQLLESFMRYRPILERLVYFKTEPTSTLAINPFTATTDTTGFLEYLIGGMVEQAMSGNMAVIFRNCLDLVQHIDNATLYTFHDVLLFGATKHEHLYPKLRDPEFFTTGRFNNSLLKTTREAVANRIDRILAIPVMRDILMSPTTKLNLKQLMDTNAVILIDNREGRVTPEGAQYLARLFIALIRDAARQRTMEHKRHRPCHVYIDECADAIKSDPYIPEIIDRCRSQLISLTVAHQRLGNVEANVRDALDTCAIKFMSNREMDLPKGTFLTNVAGYARDARVSTKELVMNSNGHFADYPVTSDADFAAMEQYVQQTYCYTPEPRKYEPPPQEPPKQERRHEPRSEPSPRQERRSESPHNTQSGPKPGRRRKGRDTDVSGEWPE